MFWWLMKKLTFDCVLVEWPLIWGDLYQHWWMGVQMPPLIAENSHFLRSGPQGAALVMSRHIPAPCLLYPYSITPHHHTSFTHLRICKINKCRSVCHFPTEVHSVFCRLHIFIGYYSTKKMHPYHMMDYCLVDVRTSLKWYIYHRNVICNATYTIPCHP